MAILLDQRWQVSAGDVCNAAVDYYYDDQNRPGQGWLDEDEMLTGTPTIAEIGSSDLTFSNAKVSTSPREILGNEVPMGKAVQFTFEGQQAATRYRVRVTAQTDLGRTVNRDVFIDVDSTA